MNTSGASSSPRPAAGRAAFVTATATTTATAPAPTSTHPPPQRPALPQQAALLRDARRAILATSLALLACVGGLAVFAGFGLDYALKAVAAWALGAALVWLGLRGGHHPHARFGAANGVTLTRLGLAALLAGLLGDTAWPGGPSGDSARPGGTPADAALAWCVLALATLTALLDAVDGALARRSGLASGFGARFDMETDAALTLLLSALVWQADRVGAWVLASGLMRYAFVAAAWRWPWLAAPLAPSRRRQAVCVAQITSLIVCLGPTVPAAAVTVIAAASLAALGASFAIDVADLARRRHRADPPPQPHPQEHRA